MDILRQIVASPRSRHPEAGLDLCYVTDHIIATSGPSGTYPQIAYRNPLKGLVRFLDAKHADRWAIWEFRAEGTGYPDEAVYGRIRHYPWPDHHPPPFALVPLIVASMRQWLREDSSGDNGERVAVVHCKAGKGRSGTICCSYLISEEGWSMEDAMARFTQRRMRAGFGPGVSIPSQVRYLGYVDRWAKHGKKYVERAVEICEVHVWGLRDGVKVAIEGYVDEGKVIKTFHTFDKSEREIVRDSIGKSAGLADVAWEVMGKKQRTATESETQTKDTNQTMQNGTAHVSSNGDVIFRPSTPVVLPSSDVNLDFERRNFSNYGALTVLTSVAHVWFNTFFEGQGPEKDGTPDDSGVFEIDFDAMDGIKGSIRKGTRAFDKMAVVWKTAHVDPQATAVINEPTAKGEVQQVRAADWRGEEKTSEHFERKLGLGESAPESTAITPASSTPTHNKSSSSSPTDDMAGVQSLGPDGTALNTALTSKVEPNQVSS